jgi:hypothetical protein
MDWVHVSKDVDAALAEMDAASDRAAAITGAAFVEEHLGLFLRGTLHRNKKVSDHMFEGSGPLAAFSCQIDLAFMVGVFSTKPHHELHILRKVRNLFAHSLNVQSFEDQQVKNLVENLTLIETEGWGVFRRTRGEERPAYLYDFKEQPPIKGARDRYLRTCKYFTSFLAMHLTREERMPRALL